MSSYTPGEGTPAWLRDYRPIEADLSTLAEFATALRDEVQLNFAPHARRVLAGFDAGVPFQAPDGFLELAEAHNAYITSQDRAVELLNAYAAATWDLATAADTVARHYRGSDAFAAATLAEVQGTLGAPADSTAVG